MKKILYAVIFVLANAAAYAIQYEVPMLDLTVPSGLADKQMYFNFGHKFMQSLNDYPSGDTSAIFKNGASLNLNARYMIWNGIEVKAGYDTLSDEKNVGVSYVKKLPAAFFNAQLDVQFFSYDDKALRGQTAKNFFYLLSAQTVPLLDERFTAAIDLGYDGYFQRAVMGLGLSFMVIKDLTIVAEYYPVIPVINKEDGEGATSVDPEINGCYGIGIRYSTYGHQFMLKFGNSTQMEARQLMQGTSADNIYVGISIMRLIDFSGAEDAQ